jgi:hypothetical protein
MFRNGIPAAAVIFYHPALGQNRGHIEYFNIGLKAGKKHPNNGIQHSDRQGHKK